MAGDSTKVKFLGKKVLPRLFAVTETISTGPESGTELSKWLALHLNGITRDRGLVVAQLKSAVSSPVRF